MLDFPPYLPMLPKLMEYNLRSSDKHPTSGEVECFWHCNRRHFLRHEYVIIVFQNRMLDQTFMVAFLLVSFKLHKSTHTHMHRHIHPCNHVLSPRRPSSPKMFHTVFFFSPAASQCLGAHRDGSPLVGVKLFQNGVEACAWAA